MFKHLPVLGSLAPLGVVLWCVHPNTATTFIAAGTVGSAIVEQKLHSMNDARKERKAAKAEAKAQQAIAPQAQSYVNGWHDQQQQQALPKPVTVINYEQASQPVVRRTV